MTSPTNFTFPRIYPLTDTQISGLSHAEQIVRLAAGGAQVVQLREKSLLSDEFYAAARDAVAAARKHGIRLIINDRVDIAKAVGADGVHLGQDDLQPSAARLILGPQAMIGISTHDLDQVRAAAAEDVDYIAFGPVFPTSTKRDPEPVTGPDILEQVRRVVGTRPLIAIGGITPENVNEIFSNGADSAAVITSILTGNGSIASRMAELLATARQSA
jgi:thiamine-phosphate pyrophosphorylase